jgi:hypothetical protein
MRWTWQPAGAGWRDPAHGAIEARWARMELMRMLEDPLKVLKRWRLRAVSRKGIRGVRAPRGPGQASRFARLGIRDGTRRTSGPK